MRGRKAQYGARVLREVMLRSACQQPPSRHFDALAEAAAIMIKLLKHWRLSRLICVARALAGAAVKKDSAGRDKLVKAAGEAPSA